MNKMLMAMMFGDPLLMFMGIKPYLMYKMIGPALTNNSSATNTFGVGEAIGIGNMLMPLLLMGGNILSNRRSRPRTRYIVRNRYYNNYRRRRY